MKYKFSRDIIKPVSNPHPSDRLIGTWFGYCPECKKLTAKNAEDPNVKYCQYCGQKVKWDAAD